MPPATAAPPYACAPDVRGILMPHCANTYDVKPEQSNPLGDAPPLLYGTPRY